MVQSNRNKLTRRAAFAVGAVAAAGLGALALRSSSRSGFTLSTADNKTLNRGNGAEPDTLDPHKAQGNWENNIIGDMFVGLMTEDAAANIIPGAALSYSASEDGLIYTFKLRPHLWSDGTPVTAEDFVFAFRRIADPKTAAQYVSILYPIRNMREAAEGKVPPEEIAVRAIDEETLEIAFRFQVPYVDQLMTHFTTFAVPRHIVEKHGDRWLQPGNIATNGPFVLKTWVPNGHIELIGNAHFFDRDRLALDRVIYYPTQDSQAALKRFRGGEFDLLTDSLPPQQIDWLKQNMARELRLWPFILSQYIQFNFRRKPFDDLRVRTALSLAIDRETICAKIERAGEQPAYNLIPPGMKDFPDAAHLTFRGTAMAARLAEAARLLAEAGFGPGSPLAFDFEFSNTTEYRLLSIGLQEMWKQIGVIARLQPSESQMHYPTLRRHDFSVAWAGWIADYRDAKNYLFLFESASTDMNYGYYINPKFDALVASSDSQKDARRRAAMLAQAEQMLLDDVAIAPVYFGVTRDLVSPQVKGWVSNNVNINRSRYLSLDRTISTV